MPDTWAALGCPGAQPCFYTWPLCSDAALVIKANMATARLTSRGTCLQARQKPEIAQVAVVPGS